MTTDTSPLPPAAATRWSPWRWVATALLLLPVQVVVWFVMIHFSRMAEWVALGLIGLFTLIALAQVVCAFVGLVKALRRRGGARAPGAALAGAVTAVAAVLTWAYGGCVALFAMGGGWGRPLRVRGRQRHPELCAGSDWSCGELPLADDLAPATRRALEALWLHDAQKEHASVPAFARVSWLLAAVGAPPELLIDCQRAVLEEIDHARRCFALAQGYGGRVHSVLPMPELAHDGVRGTKEPLWALASESLGDGCLLEEFNADVAAACAEVCEEPTTRALLRQIAREERSHAEFSWRVFAWVVERAGADLRERLHDAVTALPRYRRPTAASWRLKPLVAAADAGELLRHGRLPDERWQELWQQRLHATMARAAAAIARKEPRAAVASAVS